MKTLNQDPKPTRMNWKIICQFRVNLCSSITNTSSGSWLIRDKRFEHLRLETTAGKFVSGRKPYKDTRAPT